MLGKCSATYEVWSAMKVYICKNSMLDLKRTVFEQTKFFKGQNFIKKCNENVSIAMQNNC